MSYLPFPSGTLLDYAGATAPQGWLLCQGQAISRSIYAALFAAIGTTYGSGDGSTTFNVPNTQGIFIKGVGSQTIGAITYTGTISTKQNDAAQGHWHNTKNSVSGAEGDGGLVIFAATAAPTSVASGTNGQNATLQVRSLISDGTNGTPRIGAQTQPANMALNQIIKI